MDTFVFVYLFGSLIVPWVVLESGVYEAKRQNITFHEFYHQMLDVTDDELARVLRKPLRFFVIVGVFWWLVTLMAIVVLFSTLTKR